MTQQQAPAGWYDDPAGSGGRRYWNGSVWTDRVEGGRSAATTQRATGSRDRIPDGYMLLNGQQVPIRGSQPHQQRARISGFVIAGLIAAAAVALLFLMSTVARDSSSEPVPTEVETFEIEDFEDW
ncbi:DUF2510 domain-containing protein [Aeromicrobium choanae]|uniref:DUF2510 domain-containing protein n=1 Tax=Aeromicrobium choanae TaxID=1736691 RepID=A0A1T4YLP7_9ACTN|nr:DUF2510 domain-containing protein [Aeromicrobium choanae]SKB02719.1 Protein of unknown function [Aeromicrobium choanae]